MKVTSESIRLACRGACCRYGLGRQAASSQRVQAPPAHTESHSFRSSTKQLKRSKSMPTLPDVARRVGFGLTVNSKRKSGSSRCGYLNAF
ncbi:protein kinase [Pseudozyma hubeiensis SY62]|uniref:Protein kinase n=1 Tax=Pseudozyma hubeiensis (strain SY62) TaxID=1305764 RepID=R9NXR9_PSEHS|nr:protein kinase [Pseudozyma hubeiensis SY62]GAC93434.1 protein kinase [Pseudozyma hubeiensis SY62]